MIDSSAMPAGSPGKRIWGGWATAGFGVVVIFIFVVIQTLVALAFIINSVVKEPELDVMALAEQIISDGNLLVTATIASAVVCSGLILIIVKVRHGAGLVEYLALKSLSRKSVFAMLGITLVFIAVSSLGDLFLERPVDTDFMTSAYSSVASIPLFWIAIVIFAPFFEELFIRGFLFTGFSESRIGTAGAVILTALVFAFLHVQYGIYEISIIFVLGLILGIVRHKTGSLWASVIIHALNNLLAVIVLHLTYLGVLD